MKRSAAALALTLAAGVAQAGSSSNEPPVFPMEDIRAFASQVQIDLATRGVRVAIVGRVGRDPEDLPVGIDYTHVGLWVLSDITGADGRTYRGYRVWNLYQTEADAGVSELVQDSPVEFLTGVKRLHAGVIVPEAKMQDRLLAAVTSGVWETMHNPRYSVISNPSNNVYQNCTEHMLNLVTAAVYGTSDMARVKTNIAAHFTPQPIEVSPLRRTFGPMLAAGVEVDDHGADIATATFGSLARFMEGYGLAKPAYRIEHVPGKSM